MFLRDLVPGDTFRLGKRGRTVYRFNGFYRYYYGSLGYGSYYVYESLRTHRVFDRFARSEDILVNLV